MRPVSPVFLALALLTPACGDQPEAAPRTRAERPPVDVHVATVEVRTRPNALVLDGTLIADEASKVTSIVSGRVVKVHVERGDVVEAEAPLVDLRDVDYRLAAEAAKSQLKQARATLGMKGNRAPRPDEVPNVVAAKTDQELAEGELTRAQKLHDSGALSQAELDAARARAISARERYRSAINGARASVAAVQSARTALEQASTSAAETTVRAPFAGEIAERMISVGEFVAPQTPLVELVRTNPLRIELLVPQQHLRDVQPGQGVTVTVDALPDRVFEANVRYVSASVQRETRSLEVEAVLPNEDGVLRPGLFAKARLETAGEQTVAEVPAAAIHTEAGVSRVFLVVDGEIRERLVSVADRVGDLVLVADGLSKGDVVALDAHDRLGDGSPVNILDGAR